jgi:hypothetical protein
MIKKGEKRGREKKKKRGGKRKGRKCLRQAYPCCACRASRVVAGRFGKTIFSKPPVYLRACFDRCLQNRRKKDTVLGMKSEIELLEQLIKELVPEDLTEQDQGAECGGGRFCCICAATDRVVSDPSTVTICHALASRHGTFLACGTRTTDCSRNGWPLDSTTRSAAARKERGAF